MIDTLVHRLVDGFLITPDQYAFGLFAVLWLGGFCILLALSGLIQVVWDRVGAARRYRR